MSTWHNIEQLHDLLVDLQFLSTDSDGKWPSAHHVYTTASLWAACQESTFRRYYSLLTEEYRRTGRQPAFEPDSVKENESNTGRPPKIQDVLAFLELVKERRDQFNIEKIHRIASLFEEVLRLGSRTDKTIIPDQADCVIAEDNLRPDHATVYSFIPVDSPPKDSDDAIATVAANYIRLEQMEEIRKWRHRTHIVLITDSEGARDNAVAWLKEIETKIEASNADPEYSIATFAQAINGLCRPNSLLERLSDNIAGYDPERKLAPVPADILTSRSTDQPYKPTPDISDIVGHLPEELVRSPWKPRNIAALGSFGSGKTTLFVETVKRLTKGKPDRANGQKKETTPEKQIRQERLTQGNCVPFVFRALNLRQEPGDANFWNVEWDFLKESMHDSMGFSLSLETLPRLCELVSPIFFIDGLDEARGFHKQRDPNLRIEAIRQLHGWIRGKFPNATIVVSTRPEVLSNRGSIEEVFPGLEWTKVALRSPTIEAAKAWLQDQKGKSAELYQDLMEDIFDTDVDETFRRPLGLVFLSKIPPRNIETMLSEEKKLKGAAHLECLRLFVNTWSFYELAKSKHLSTEIDTGHRQWWAERLALLTTEIEIEYPGGQKGVSELEMLIDLINAYERPGAENLSEPEGKVIQAGTLDPDKKRILREAIAVSMLMVLDIDRNRLTFASRSIRQFLVARHFQELFQDSDPVTDTERSARRKRDDHLVRGHLGRIDLNREVPLARMLLGLAKKTYQLEPVELAGRIRSEIDFVSAPSTGYPSWAPYRYLKSNLLLLLALALGKAGGNEEIVFSGRDLAYVEAPDKLAYVEVPDKYVEAPGETLRNILVKRLRLERCNLEKSDSLLEIFGPDKLREQGCFTGYLPGQDRREKVKHLDKYLMSISPASPQTNKTIGFIKLPEKGHGDEKISRKFLGDFVLIPGGEREFMTRKPAEKASLASDESFGVLSEPQLNSRLTVTVPTMLVQQHPVSNLQFAYFVAQKPEYGKDRRRKKLGNTYYLSGWDFYRKYKSGMDEFLQCLETAIKEGNPNPIATAEKEYRESFQEKGYPSYEEFKKEWLDAPVVYVDWLACDAFAEHFGLRLPWEAEFEYLLRSYFCTPDNQNYDRESDRLDIREFQTYDQKDTLTGLTVIPLNNKGVQASWEVQKKFARGGRAETGLGDAIPLDVIGRVWEWMREVWSSEWPPIGFARTEEEPPRLAPNGRSFPIFRGGKDKKLPDGTLTDWQSAVRLSSRCTRGNSYLFAGEDASWTEVSRRAPMPVINVNHDIGFRCVADLRTLFSEENPT
uniref:Formylglycine-generating enzyme, required for sulfatase activity, contains SUMF1/FGE domain n=1 Tax=Candidatus Kentrum sp. FW TaxID=2126338 RepID=A0A450SPW5_9GAMM|nr:MAG: Formylglycine-generating enzyme, required for sulfatase activity, contains SUMF1/FGE domain [Candidatus Kentron sp. FW]